MLQIGTRVRVGPRSGMITRVYGDGNVAVALDDGSTVTSIAKESLVVVMESGSGSVVPVKHSLRPRLPPKRVVSDALEELTSVLRPGRRLRVRPAPVGILITPVVETDKRAIEEGDGGEEVGKEGGGEVEEGIVGTVTRADVVGSRNVGEVLAGTRCAASWYLTDDDGRQFRVELETAESMLRFLRSIGSNIERREHRGAPKYESGDVVEVMNRRGKVWFPAIILRCEQNGIGNGGGGDVEGSEVFGGKGRGGAETPPHPHPISRAVSPVVDGMDEDGAPRLIRPSMAALHRHERVGGEDRESEEDGRLSPVSGASVLTPVRDPRGDPAALITALTAPSKGGGLGGGGKSYKSSAEGVWGVFGVPRYTIRYSRAPRTIESGVLESEIRQPKVPEATTGMLMASLAKEEEEWGRLKLGTRIIAPVRRNDLDIRRGVVVGCGKTYDGGWEYVVDFASRTDESDDAIRELHVAQIDLLDVVAPPSSPPTSSSLPQSASDGGDEKGSGMYPAADDVEDERVLRIRRLVMERLLEGQGPVLRRMREDDRRGSGFVSKRLFIQVILEMGVRCFPRDVEACAEALDIRDDSTVAYRALVPGLLGPPPKHYHPTSPHPPAPPSSTHDSSAPSPPDSNSIASSWDSSLDRIAQAVAEAMAERGV